MAEGVFVTGPGFLRNFGMTKPPSQQGTTWITTPPLWQGQVQSLRFFMEGNRSGLIFAFSQVIENRRVKNLY